MARIELGAGQYSLRSLLNNESAVALPIAQAPGANALELSDEVRATMKELSKNFPEGITYQIVYDPTVFVRDSIKAVIETLLEALALVVIVVILFLQTWRAVSIPLIAVPVSIVGTFGLMLAFGFSINALSLFGLVLADRHRRRRRDRGRRERRAQHRERPVAARGDLQGDGKSAARSSRSRWC